MWVSGEKKEKEKLLRLLYNILVTFHFDYIHVAFERFQTMQEFVLLQKVYRSLLSYELNNFHGSSKLMVK